MPKLFNQEQEKFIRANSNGRGNKELSDLLNKEFGLSISPKQLANWRGNHNVRSCTSIYGWKKGKKAGVDFKPQKEFRNSLPLGSEGETKGVITVKIAPGKWIPKHRFLWEKEHGSVPGGHVVIFADGNKRNFDMENLVLVSKKHLAILNKKRLLIGDKEIREMALNYAKLVEKIADKKKEASNRD